MVIVKVLIPLNILPVTEIMLCVKPVPIMCFIQGHFSQKTGKDIPCKFSPLETMCIKCLILFSGKNRKNISFCHLVKILPSILSVNIKNSLVLNYQIFIIKAIM